MSDIQHSIEAATIAIANKTTVIGGGTAAIAGAADKVGLTVVTSSGTLDIAGFCALAGLMIAMLGYFTSVYFQWRRDCRESAEFRRRFEEK